MSRLAIANAIEEVKKSISSEKLMKEWFGVRSGAWSKYLNAAWNSDLHCHWRSIRAVGPDILQIELPEHDCTDMSGTIRLSKYIMPKVKKIIVINGNGLDIVYLLDGKEWKPISYR